MFFFTLPHSFKYLPIVVFDGYHGSVGSDFIINPLILASPAFGLSRTAFLMARPIAAVILLLDTFNFAGNPKFFINLE